MLKILIICPLLIVSCRYAEAAHYNSASQSSRTRCNSRNEVFSPCGNNECQRTCAQPTRNENCNRNCVEGCICAEGFLRDSRGNCVSPDDCDCSERHEIFSLCGNHPCQDTCDNPTLSRRCNFQSGCYPGCVCRNGYLRDSNGKCVHQRKCSSFSCPRNEAFENCYDPLCEGTCANPILRRNCERTTNCISGCFCVAGHVRNDLGRCVLPSACSPIISCIRANEIFSQCGNNNCQRTCDNLNGDQPCIPNCNPGCVCEVGFVRNSVGNCVPPSSCPSTCTGINEIFSECDNNNCQKTCDNFNSDRLCASVCTPGCVCRNGFVRNRGGICVLPSLCPTLCPRPNEIFSECGNDNCQPTCSRPTPDRKCISTCIPGCICARGFVRDNRGICIIPESCPSACNTNEVFSECGNNNCQATCANPNGNPTCIPTCIAGCICIDGFVKNSFGQCVPASSCIQTCPNPNEIFSQCGNNNCQPTCNNPIANPSCIPVCTPGCICNNGFVRNNRGECVPIQSCPPTCPRPNEIFSQCGNNNCQITCNNPNGNPSCVPTCISGCICATGFVRNDRGDCVPPTSCPQSCPRSNEIFSQCGNNDCQATCENPNGNPLCLATCIPGCICSSGYVRNANGDCIPPSLCPATTTCNGQNEIFSQCGNNNCQATCTNPNGNPSCESTCISGCICKSGFVRNNAGVCIPPSSCPSTTICTRPNEIFSQCDNNNCQATCTNPNGVPSCVPTCISGCVCASGFIRNNIGACIRPSECPATCSRPNEIFSQCGNNNCQATCDNPNGNPSCENTCISGCICSNGFVRNNQGDCIPPSECQALCGRPNEIFSQCGNNNCQPDCNNEIVDPSCIPTCIPGCICQDGFLRDVDGSCVELNQCSSRRCFKDHEIFIDCSSDCHRKCTDLSLIDQSSSDEASCSFEGCTRGCGCEPNFFRHSDGSCVPASDCDCGENEELNPCPKKCHPRTCRALFYGYGSCHYNSTICKPKCECKFNYRRDINGVCIPIEDCPPLMCSGSNEIYEPCPDPCLDETCKKDHHHHHSRCSRHGNQECRPKCICKPGYRRNKHQQCIPESECQPCSDPNAEFQICGNICPRNCTNYLEKDRNCPRHCSRPGGCVCKSGYVEDEAGKCILPIFCPVPKCNGPHEIYSKCETSYCEKTCENLDERHCYGACTPGCICEPGYVRNSENICVHPEQCPITPICTGKHEIRSNCGNAACQKTCEDLNGPDNCIAVCIPGCVCSEGYVRNKYGTCIPIEDCGIRSCIRENEEYTNCVSCGRNCLDLKRPSICQKDLCRPGCDCKPGFYRNSKGDCVTKRQCDICDDPNAEYHPCGNLCRPIACGTTNRVDRHRRYCPERCESQGSCVCKPGYMQNFDGKCVLPEECNICGFNKIFKKCGNIQCENTCDEPDRHKSCTPFLDCEPGCYCLEGFVRNDKFECVPRDHCVSYPKCHKPNEVYSMCDNNDCQKTCKNVFERHRKHCQYICIPGCVCDKGFVRNDRNECIPEKYCEREPKCYGPHEIYSPCENNGCQRTCENIISKHHCNSICIPGCICSPGYYRNKKGICVLKQYCEQVSCDRPNEIYTECVSPCNTCENYGNPCNFLVCNPGCDCQPGYVRDFQGSCIKPSSCPQQSVCQAGEELDDCYNPCPPDTCDALDKNYKCPPFKQRSCKKGCKCKKDYKRNDKGICIPSHQCPRPICEKPNEIFTQCEKNNCQKTCRNYKTFSKTNCRGNCVQGCICAEGFVKNDNGDCVRPDQCDIQECPENEEATNCKKRCPPESCETFGKQYKCRNDARDPCVKGCKCKKNYRRNALGICVPSEQCGMCGWSEVFEECGKLECERSCDDVKNLRNRERCRRSSTCKSGCYCKPGSFRNNKGKCVTHQECGVISNCSGPHEVFSPCGNNSCQNRCQDRKVNKSNCVGPCVAGCVCENGFFRNDEGKCVPYNSCEGNFLRSQICIKPNEVYTKCNNNICQKTCKNRNIKSNCTANCIPGCICAEGYMKNQNGICVRPQNCVVKDFFKCPENEVLDECLNPCPPDTCRAHGKTFNCLPIDVCKKGCKCKPNYKRNPNGKCIPVDHCYDHRKCNEPNEVYSRCENHECQTTCRNYTISSNTRYLCKGKCEPGCMCEKGYVKNDRGKCVRPQECVEVPKCMGYNEMYSKCGNTICQKSCKNMHMKTNCEAKCQPGCICRNGFVKNKYGKCILPDECEINSACEENEMFSLCGNNNCQKTCFTIDDKYCRPYCRAGCVCKKEFVRNINGKCVRRENCDAKVKN